MITTQLVLSNGWIKVWACVVSCPHKTRACFSVSWVQLYGAPAWTWGRNSCFPPFFTSEAQAKFLLPLSQGLLRLPLNFFQENQSLIGSSFVNVERSSFFCYFSNQTSYLHALLLGGYRDELLRRLKYLMIGG